MENTNEKEPFYNRKKDINNNILKLNSSQEKPKRSNINLCKKYFYMQQPKNIIQLNKLNNETILEKIDNILTKLETKRNDLFNTKIDCIKSMVLSNQKIPEKWIMKSDYKDILETVMKDDIVLNYAIACKDIHRKRAGLDNDDDDDVRYEKYMKSLPREKKFISYINPYTKNYCDTSRKKILMREYDKKITKQKEKDKSYSFSYKKIIKLPNIKEEYKNNKYNNNKYNNISLNKNKKKCELETINNNNNITTNNNISNYTETKNDLMVTSLHYTGLGLDNNQNGENLRKKLEIKLPEISVI